MADYPPPPPPPPPSFNDPYGSMPPGSSRMPPPPPPFPQSPMYMSANSPAVPMSSGTNGWATASFVCSLLGLCTGFTGILGIIFGHIALSQIKQSPFMQGRGLALAGLIIGYAEVGLWVLIVIIAALSSQTTLR